MGLPFHHQGPGYPGGQYGGPAYQECNDDWDQLRRLMARAPGPERGYAAGPPAVPVSHPPSTPGHPGPSYSAPQGPYDNEYHAPLAAPEPAVHGAPRLSPAAVNFGAPMGHMAYGAGASAVGQGSYFPLPLPSPPIHPSTPVHMSAPVYPSASAAPAVSATAVAATGAVVTATAVAATGAVVTAIPAAPAALVAPAAAAASVEQAEQVAPLARYLCDVCSKPFELHKDLKRHASSTRGHEGSVYRSPDAVTYQCRCGYSVWRKDNYKRHVARCKRVQHHPTFQCKCGHRCAELQEHRDHITDCRHGNGQVGRPGGAARARRND